jgi:hypothetical protein
MKNFYLANDPIKKKYGKASQRQESVTTAHTKVCPLKMPY